MELRTTVTEMALPWVAFPYLAHPLGSRSIATAYFATIATPVFGLRATTSDNVVLSLVTDDEQHDMITVSGTEQTNYGMYAT